MDKMVFGFGHLFQIRSSCLSRLCRIKNSELLRGVLEASFYLVITILKQHVLLAWCLVGGEGDIFINYFLFGLV